MKQQPYVDKFGILHVPWLRNQAIGAWDEFEFEARRKPTAEFFRSVDRPRKDGKTFSPSAWLKAAINRYSQSGGAYSDCGENRYHIEPRETDPQILAEHYWEMQDTYCWGAHDAWILKYKPQQWVSNLCKRFGITDRDVKGRITRHAIAMWAEWSEQEYYAEIEILKQRDLEPIPA